MEDYDDYSFLKAYMGQDEQILWKGRPEKGNLILKEDLFLIPFSVFWLGFAVFWVFGAAQSGGFFALFGLPFVAVGCFMLFGRFFYKSAKRNETYYVVTNKKLIIKTNRNVKIYMAGDLPPMKIEIHKNGNGTIIFSQYVRTRNTVNYSTDFQLENLHDYVAAQNAICSMER